MAETINVVIKGRNLQPLVASAGEECGTLPAHFRLGYGGIATRRGTRH